MRSPHHVQTLQLLLLLLERPLRRVVACLERRHLPPVDSLVHLLLPPVDSLVHLLLLRVDSLVQLLQPRVDFSALQLLPPEVCLEVPHQLQHSVRLFQRAVGCLVHQLRHLAEVVCLVLHPLLQVPSAGSVLHRLHLVDFGDLLPPLLFSAPLLHLPLAVVVCLVHKRLLP